MSLEDEMKKRGAIHSADGPWQPHVVQDGLLITGQQPQSAPEMAEKIIAAGAQKP
jgi:putative intracellular protease/amidase